MCEVYVFFSLNNIGVKWIKLCESKLTRKVQTALTCSLRTTSTYSHPERAKPVLIATIRFTYIMVLQFSLHPNLSQSPKSKSRATKPCDIRNLNPYLDVSNLCLECSIKSIHQVVSIKSVNLSSLSD